MGIMKTLAGRIFKRPLREKLYPPRVRKDKSNEFASVEMGNLTVDKYYQKFMEYMRFCPEDIPTEDKKMQRFKLRLTSKDPKTCRE